MLTAFFACAAILQKGPTTPIYGPPAPPPVKKKVAVHKKKKIIGEKPVQTKKPFVVIPDVVDKPVGSGDPVKAGDLITVQFLVQKKSGETIADSKKRGLAYTFRIGDQGNDPLLDLVVKGMRVGGIRVETLPAAQAYGSAGAPPLISPKDVLVVTVNLLRRGT